MEFLAGYGAVSSSSFTVSSSKPKVVMRFLGEGEDEEVELQAKISKLKGTSMHALEFRRVHGSHASYMGQVDALLTAMGDLAEACAT